MQAGDFRGFDYLLHRRVRLAVADIFPDGGGKEEGVLVHDADVPPQRFQRYIADVLAFDGNAAWRSHHKSAG